MLLVLVAVLILPSPTTADIYLYVDENGVRHFTNTPTSSRYKRYIKGKSRHRPPLNKKRYDALIRKAARKFGVAFSLIKAVIEVESAYDPRAVSPKGARGLMQIMPFNFSRLYIKDAFEPAQNIMGGTRYLNDLIIKYNGKISHALAAYNAGPGTVDRYNGIPPYPETQEYVRRVMALHRTYKGMVLNF